MDTIRETPSNPIIQGVIDALRWSKAKIAPIVGEKGSWLHANAPEFLIPEAGLGELQNWAQGNWPMELPPEGTGSRIPRFKLDREGSRAGAAVDAASLLPIGAAAKLAKAAPIAGGLEAAFKLPGGNILLPESAKSTNPTSPIGSWRTKQLTNYLRRKFGTGDDPVGVLHEKSPEFRQVLEDMDNNKYSEMTMDWFHNMAENNPNVGSEFKKLITKHQELTPREFNAWDRFVGDNTKVQPRSEWGSYYSLALPEDMRNLPADATIYSFPGQNLNRLLGNTAYNLSMALNAMSPDARGTALALRRAGLQISEKDLDQMSAVDALRHYGYSQKAINHYSNPNAPINRGADIKVGKPFDDGSHWVQYNRDDIDLAHSGMQAEGKLMSHCIGDNCEDYLPPEGKSEVFSLRDKSGKPVITAAVDEHGFIYEARGKANRKLTLDELKKLRSLEKDAGLNKYRTNEQYLNLFVEE